MSDDPLDRVDQLLRSGKITPEEAERLRLAWLESEPANRPLPASRFSHPRRLILLVTIAAALGALAFVTGRALSPRRTNLIRNGGFESATVSGRDWDARNLSGASRFESIEGDAPEGRRFGRIVTSPGDDRGFVNSWMQVLPLPKDVRFVSVSLRVRTRETPLTVVDLQLYGATERLARREIARIEGSRPWTVVERELRVPPRADSLAFAIQVRGAGEVDVDDVCVEPIASFRFESGDELIANGGFEEAGESRGGAEAWRVPRSPDGVRYSVERSEGRGLVAVASSAVSTEGLAWLGWSQDLDRFPEEVDLVLSADVRSTASGIADVELIATSPHEAAPFRRSLVPPDANIPVLDWRHHEQTIRVPAGVEIVTIRCTLRGTGTAAFDRISLRVLATKRS